VAKRPDLNLNELGVPEWAELALDKVEWRKLQKGFRKQEQYHYHPAHI
jgi:hypothetical protein